MLLAALILAAQAGTACASVDDCRQQALAAATRGEYETFHDLAWRAAQKGRPNDPDLMLLLARAMALSGRPGDALVMLGRLADMGITVDVSGDDFRRVRALKGWPDLEARLATPTAPKKGTVPIFGAKKGTAATAGGAEAPADAVPPADAASAPAGEPFAFEAPPFEPAGLGYDEVSRRFLVGDRRAARLMVVDQASHHVTPLVGAAAAGFYDTLTGFTIDHRRGDLWVVSTQGVGDAAESALHKLQLVSGRVLLQVSVEAGARLVDVAVAPDGTVYAVDATRDRVLRLRPGTRALDLAAPLGVEGCSTITVVDDRAAFVGCQTAIVRLDLSSHMVSPVPVPAVMEPVELLRGSGRSLFAVEHGTGSRRLIRLTLDEAGRAVTRSHVLDSSVPATSAATVAGSNFYYMSRRGEIRAVRLR